MQLSITKINGTDEFLFQAKITENNCAFAKQIALDTNAVFRLDLGPSNPAGSQPIKEITLDSLIGLLEPDEETEEFLRELYPSSIAVSNLSVSCSGYVNLSIINPEVDAQVKLEESLVNSLEVGLGFTFRGAIRFDEDDMECRN